MARLGVLALALAAALAGAAAGEGDAAACAAGGDGTCAAARGGAAEFWAEMRKRGLKLKLRKKTVEEKAEKGLPARSRTAMVLSDDVFYGRAIMKIPRRALLSVETMTVPAQRQELVDFLFEDRVLERKYNVTTEDLTHLISLAYPLILEDRDPSSVFRQWLDAVRDQKLTALELTERQRRILSGTTVEGACEEMERHRDLILYTARNLTFFRTQPVTKEEASWALAVIMRHARVVHPHQDVRETRSPRMYIFPLMELLDVQLSPDVSLAISFQEEILLEGKREEELVLQIARRDMPKGEEIFLWPGRLSNSEMAVRHGISFPSNPIGIGRNTTEPPNWSLVKESNIRKEYDRYNCTSLESFELRLSPKGYPMRQFIKCFRVSWFLTNGWYSPAMADRQRELMKWPPPPKYSKDDWLAWTQADRECNSLITEYCKMMRQKLKDTMDSATAEDFRKSADPTDKLLWNLRGEESKTFKECVALAKSIT